MAAMLHSNSSVKNAIAGAGEEAAVMSFKVIDFGHARLIGDKPGASLPGSPQMEKWYRRW